MTEEIKDILGEEDLEEAEDDGYILDFEEVQEVRKHSLAKAFEFWNCRVESTAELSSDDMIRFPNHVSTVLDTARHIEKYLMGDFDSAY